MAFGEKQRKIEELQGQVQHLEAELVALQPWIGLAQSIRASAAGYAAEMDQDTAIDHAINDAAQEQRQALMIAAFNSLSPEEQLDRLVTNFGDDALREALEGERQRRLSQTDSDLAIELIVKEAREHRRFSPRDLPKDTDVEVFLYREGVLDKHVLKDVRMSDPRDNGDDCSRHIVGVATGTGGITVRHDDIRSVLANKHNYRYPDHETMSLRLPGPCGSSPPLAYGASIYVPSPSSYTHYGMKLDLGPVFVNGIDIFDVVEESAQA